MLQWLAIIALGVWVVLLSQRVGRLEARERAARSQAPVTPRALARPPADPDPAPASREASPWTPPPQPAAPLASSPPPPPTAPEPPTAAPPRLRAPALPAAAVSEWLAENGLAWLGGAGLTLGGLFLVLYAAERGFFTPVMRIGAAVVAGLAMLAVSEVIRRRRAAPSGPHRLAAALTAGAGAATAYGAVWAAFALYRLIPFGAAAPLIVAISAGLIALALLHGEALAIAGLAGALLAPAIIGPGRWSPAGLEIFLILVATTGFAVGGLRRWGHAGWVTIAGLAAWTLVGLAADRVAGAAVLSLAAPVLAIAAGRWRPSGGRLWRLQPVIALATTAFLSLGFWTGGNLFAPTGSIALLAILAAFAAAARLAPPAVFLAPAVAAVVGALMAATIGRFRTAVAGIEGQALYFSLLAVLAVSALAAGRLRADGRALLVGAGAFAAALLANLDFLLLDRARAAFLWQAPATAAAVLALGAPLLARVVADKARDVGLGLWIAACAELVFVALHAAIGLDWAPPAHAAAAALLALLGRRLGWRGLAQSAAAGGLVVLATLLRPAFVGDVMHGRLGLPALALTAGAATLLLFGASRILRGRPAELIEADALSTAALLAGLFAGFWGLHLVVAGPKAAMAGQGLVETSLRTAALLVAALLLILRLRPDAGIVARWRAWVFLAAGLAHGAVCQVIVLDPWWGFWPEPVAGPIVFDTLTPAYLIPAGLLAAIASRGLPGPRRNTWAAGGLAAGAALLAAAMEIRHLARGPHLNVGAVGQAEAAAYALLIIGAARAAVTASTGEGRSALAPILRGCVWAALVVTAWLDCAYASPWWGQGAAPLTSTLHAALLFGLFLAVAATTLSISRRAGAATLARGALVTALGELFVVITLLVRWLFRGRDLNAVVAHAGVETWTFSAVWAVFGLATLSLGGARGDPTLRWAGLAVLIGTVVKVVLFDMAHLDGMIRAASFLAVGALLVVGALAARRYRQA